MGICSQVVNEVPILISLCEFSKFQPDEQNSCPITPGIQIVRDFSLSENGAKTNQMNLMIVLGEKNAWWRLSQNANLTISRSSQKHCSQPSFYGQESDEQRKKTKVRRRLLQTQIFTLKAWVSCACCCPIFNQGHTIGRTFESLEVNSHHKKHSEALIMD